MVQLNLYLRELSDFLRTVTIKDNLVADNMFAAWVKDEYNDLVANDITAHPYYRNLLGNYIVFDHSSLLPVIQQLYDNKYLFNHESTTTTVQEVLDTLFPLKTKIKVYDSYGNYIVREIPNIKLYNYCNEVPIISSYDTQTQIPFVKEFLYETGTSDALDIRIHNSTSVVYRIPNDRYNTLTSKYRSVSAIIRSIVYPVKVDLASNTVLTTAQLEKLRLQKLLDAPDMSLLAYDYSMLEESEQQSMLDCLNDTLAMIRRRYAVRELGYENLFAPAHYYITWQVLYLALFVQRICNIKSGDAHTYHIWNYLKSHGFEDYRDVLSVLQQKFLYKNLPYLIKNKGTERAFEILDYVFFQSENIILSGKNTIQSVDNGEQSITDTTKKYPTVRSIRVAKPMLDGITELKKTSNRFEDVLKYMGVNAGLLAYNDQQEYSFGVNEDLNQLYQKERAEGLEYQNDNLFERSTNEQTTLMSYSPVSHRNTKLLELQNNNTVDDYFAIYGKFIAETLFYRLSKDNLKFSLSIQLPNSTKWITLPIQEWMAMVFYALDRTNSNYQKYYVVSSPYEKEKKTKRKNPNDPNDKSMKSYFDWKPLYYVATETTRLPGTTYYIYTETGYREWTEQLQEGVTYYKARPWDNRLNKTDHNLCDRPPMYAALAWPYTLDDDYALSETFWWNGTKHRSDLSLARLASAYTFYETSVEDNVTNYSPKYQFYLADNSVKLSNYTRYWKTTDGLILRYNQNKKWWNIVDKDENLLYYSAKTVSGDSNLSYLTWFTADHTQVNFVMKVDSSDYLVNFLMPQYQSTITSKEQCATALHDQGLGFLLMYVSANHDESAIHRAAYHSVLQKRCVEQIVGIDLLHGLTYEQYLSQHQPDVEMLKLVLDHYDSGNDAETMYSMMVDAILEAILPKNDPYLSVHAKTAEFKYGKLIQLFKSMTAYNLAYIGLDYTDVDSTKLSVNNSDYAHFDINIKITDNCSTMTDRISWEVCPVYRPTDMDLMYSIKLTFKLADDADIDTELKLELLNNIDKIVDTLTARRVSKNKKKQRLLQFLPEELVEQIVTFPIVQLQNIQDAVHRVREDHTSVQTHILDTDNDNINEEISDITISSN